MMHLSVNFCSYDLCPQPLNELVVLYVNERELRSNDSLLAIVPKCRTQFGERNFAYRATIIWNSIPYDLKCSSSIDSFKEALKQYEGFN